MNNNIILIIPAVILLFLAFLAIEKKPLSGYKIVFFVSYVIFGLIYWLDLDANIKYVIYLLMLILHIKISSVATEKTTKRRISLFFIVIIISSIVLNWFNLFLVQSIVGYIFFFLPFFIAYHFKWDVSKIQEIFKFLLYLWLLQLIIGTVQRFIFKLPIDLISGSLGRAETQNISIMGSFFVAVGIGLIYFYKRKMLGYTLIICSMYFYIISEAKAGFIFSIINAAFLPLFFVNKKYSNARYLLLIAFIIVISGVSVFYILPKFFDIELAAKVFSSMDYMSDYFSNNYSERYVRVAALESVFMDVLNNPKNLMFGYGLGSMTSSTFLGESQIGPNMLFLYSMASESVIYFLQVGVIGTAVFVMIFVSFQAKIWKISRDTDHWTKLLCYLTFSLNFTMLFSFVIYCRPYRSIPLSLILFTLTGILFSSQKKNRAQDEIKA